MTGCVGNRGELYAARFENVQRTRVPICAGGGPAPAWFLGAFCHLAFLGKEKGSLLPRGPQATGVAIAKG